MRYNMYLDMANVTLIKLGGSVITDKTKPDTMRHEVLERLVSEIVQFRQEDDELLVVGHGQGGFAHFPAKKYRTKEGFITDESRFGMGMTQHSVGRSHQLVLQALLDQSLPVVSFRVASALVTTAGVAVVWSGKSLAWNLRNGLVPVTCGDVVVDTKQGCTIWSTEVILEHLAKYLPEEGFVVSRVIHVTDVDGVLTADGKTISKITPQTAAQVRKSITDPTGTDVTGGMWHKLESSVELAKQGIDTAIISGIKPKNLYNCLSRQRFVGTTVTIA